MTDADLDRKLATVFVPGGEPCSTLLLGNLAHLVDRDCQLFLVGSSSA